MADKMNHTEMTFSKKAVSSQDWFIVEIAKPRIVLIASIYILMYLIILPTLMLVLFLLYFKGRLSNQEKFKTQPRMARQ